MRKVQRRTDWAGWGKKRILFQQNHLPVFSQDKMRICSAFYMADAGAYLASSAYKCNYMAHVHVLVARVTQHVGLNPRPRPKHAHARQDKLSSQALFNLAGFWTAGLP